MQLAIIITQIYNYAENDCVVFDDDDDDRRITFICDRCRSGYVFKLVRALCYLFVMACTELLKK